jgi:membrane-bound serine protease (ClpP class)
LFAIVLLILIASVLIAAPKSNPVVLSAEQAASGPGGKIVIVNFDVPVDLGSSSLMQRAVSYAISQNASAMVILMNTPGGLLSDMVSIISSITQANASGIPVYTYVPPNALAASAGSYIAMASNGILMGTGSEIGPSTPIVVGGTDLEQNHTEAAMLNLMVSLAQEWGRNSTAAYAMVYSDQAFTATDASSIGLIDGVADSLNQSLAVWHLQGNPQETLSENLYEEFLSTISNSTLDGILIMLGILALLLELYHPTIFLTIVGGVAIIAGFVGAEEIGASIFGFAILAVAAGLVLLELKLGHGFAVIAGMVLGAVGILYLSQGLSYSPTPINASVEIELTVLVAVGIMSGLYIRWILGPIRKKKSFTGPESLIGKIGVAINDLKPTGDVRVEGIIWRAKFEPGTAKAGEAVKVKAVEGLMLVVEKAAADKT